MYEMYPSEAANANINPHLDEVGKSLQIREGMQGPTNNRCDPFSSHLPPEITSHIFSIYTEAFNSSFDVRDPPTERSGPLLLAAVSKRWREVAFSTPQLWNTLNIHISWPVPSNMPREIDLAKQWLDRSSELPLYLSLRIFHSIHISHDQIDTLRPLFHLIRNFAPRWHILALIFSTKLYDTFLDGLTCAPRLHTLRLIDHSGDGRFYLPQTPLLKHLEISNHFLSDIIVEWGNLKNFEANDFAVDEVFELFRRAGRLSSCRLGGISSELSRYPIPATPLTHSALKRLCLAPSDLSERELEILFRFLIFPSLEKLEYEGKWFFPLDGLILFINCSYCQLTHFDLSGDLTEVTDNDLVSLLSSMPTVTHFKLEDVEDRDNENDGIMTDKLLQKLTPTEGMRAALLPCLQSLKFHGEQKFSWNSLAEFVSAGLTEDNNNGFVCPTTGKMNAGRNSLIIQHRNTSRNPIRHVSFIVRCPERFIDSNVLVRFNCARDAGVSIEIMHETLDKWSHSTTRSLLQTP